MENNKNLGKKEDLNSRKAENSRAEDIPKKKKFAGSYLAILIKVYVIAIAVELSLDRFIYRVGTALNLGQFYYVLDDIGTYARYLLVLLNFTFLIVIVASKDTKPIIKIPIGIQTMFFFIYYLNSIVGNPMDIYFDVVAKIFALITLQIVLGRFLISSEKPKIGLKSIVILLQIIVSFGIIYLIAFTYNSRFYIEMDPFLKLSQYSQIMAATILCWVTFTVALVHALKYKKETGKKVFATKSSKILLIVNFCLIVVTLGLVNGGIEIVTEEHVITFYDIFSWTVIYVLGFSQLYIGVWMINLSIIGLWLFMNGVIIFRRLGNLKNSIVLNQLAYGLFIIFCTSYLFLEYEDIFFLIELFIGLCIIGISVDHQKNEKNEIKPIVKAG